MSSYQRKRSVSVNDRGHTVGQDHHRSKLTDHDVELVLSLRAEGLTHAEIAEKFDVSKALVASICQGRRRAQLGTGQKLTGNAPRFKHRKPARPEEFDDAYIGPG